MPWQRILFNLNNGDDGCNEYFDFYGELSGGLLGEEQNRIVLPGRWSWQNGWNFWKALPSAAPLSFFHGPPPLCRRQRRRLQWRRWRWKPPRRFVALLRERTRWVRVGVWVRGCVRACMSMCAMGIKKSAYLWEKCKKMRDLVCVSVHERECGSMSDCLSLCVCLCFCNW